MRSRKVGVTSGTVQPRLPWPRRTIVRAVALVFGVLVVWAFVQEAWTAHQLQARASAMRSQNAALEAQNNAYERDIGAVQSGAAAEEVARQNGYSKPGERIYVIASPPAAVPPPAAIVRNTSPPGPLAGVEDFVKGLTGHLHPSR